MIEFDTETRQFGVGQFITDWQRNRYNLKMARITGRDPERDRAESLREYNLRNKLAEGEYNAKMKGTYQERKGTYQDRAGFRSGIADKIIGHREHMKGTYNDHTNRIAQSN